MSARLSASALLVVVAAFVVPFTLASSAGTVLRGKVDKITHPDAAETHVWLSTSGGSEEVCLGDSHFLADNSFSPSLGEVVEISGVRNGTLLVADSIRRGDQTLTLRGRGNSGQYQGHHACHHCYDYQEGGCYGHGCYGHDHYGHDCGHGYHHWMHE